MKKLLKAMIILLTIFLIPNFVKAAEVTIENITLVEHSEFLTEKSPATANGLGVNFDLSFTEIDDYAKYKVVINNPTNTEYEIEQETDFTTSNYVQYTYSYEGDAKVLKANSKLTMYITLTYKNSVPTSELQDGKYIETNKLTVNLSNGTTNPKTADASTLVLSGLTVLLIGSLILYKVTNRKEVIGTLVVLMILIPIAVYAAEKLKINVETKITVEEKYSVSYYAYELIKVGEEINYTIFNSSSYPCRYINDDEEYEVCYVEVSKEVYAPGETVHLKEQLTLHRMGEDENIHEYNMFLDGLPHSDWYVDTEAQYARWLDYTHNTRVIYGGYINGPEPVDFSETSIVSDQWNNHYTIKAPGTFTMPKHNMIFTVDIVSGPM